MHDGQFLPGSRQKAAAQIPYRVSPSTRHERVEKIGRPGRAGKVNG
jgi:hypothetical protein